MAYHSAAHACGDSGLGFDGLPAVLAVLALFVLLVSAPARSGTMLAQISSSHRRRHFPECADRHRAQARSEGEGFLPGIQHKSCDEIVA